MRFYNTQHLYYCGIDLHTRSSYVCILNQDGETVVHRNLPADPDEPTLYQNNANIPALTP